MASNNGPTETGPGRRENVDRLRRSAATLEGSEHVHDTDPCKGLGGVHVEALASVYGPLTLVAGPSTAGGSGSGRPT